MKIKRKNEIIEIDKSEMIDGDEEVTETPEATPEGGTPEIHTDDQKKIDADEIKEVSEAIGDKIKEAFAEIQANPVEKSPVYHKEEVTITKSVMETDPFLRSKRPFVKLSPVMENFIGFVRAMNKNNLVGMQKAFAEQEELKKVIPAQEKALQEDDDIDGGFTVPEEFQSEIVRYMDEAAVIRPIARVFNMTRDTLRLPSLDQSSTVFGGFSFNEVDEEGSATEDSPKFGKVTLRAKKVIGLTYISSELLEDSAINIANFMVTLMGEALADLEDSRFLTGSGMGQPLGVTISEGTNVFSRISSTRIKYEDILGMWKNTLATFDRNAVWITNKAGVEQLMLINQETTSGLLLWLPNLRDAIPTSVLSRPLLITERVQSLGTNGDIIYGDFTKYFIGDRGAIKVDSSIHNRFENDQTTLRMIKRYDGQPAIAKAFTKLRE